jgi:hypothetical protein
MPGIQELIALSVVALVAGRLLWRQWAKRRAQGSTAAKSSACGDCSSAGPPPKEPAVRFYRRVRSSPEECTHPRQEGVVALNKHETDEHQ